MPIYMKSKKTEQNQTKNPVHLNIPSVPELNLHYDAGED